MKKALLLLGLIGCVPQSPVVEVPTVIQIPKAPKSPIEEAKPVRHIQWTVERDTEEIEREVVSPYLIIFKKDGLVITTTLVDSVLTVECSSGIKVDTYCAGTHGRFSFTCNGDWYATNPFTLKISCDIETIQGE